MKKWQKKILSAVPALAVMIIIFGFSAQHAEESNASSNYIVEQLIEVIQEVQEIMGIEGAGEASGLNLDLMTFIIRKLAHTFEYAVLGASICFALYYNGLRRKKLVIVTLLSGFLYACTDELHQFFVPGRSCEFRDVLIDTNGVFLGMLVFLCVLWRITKKKGKAKASKSVV